MKLLARDEVFEGRKVLAKISTHQRKGTLGLQKKLLFNPYISSSCVKSSLYKETQNKERILPASWTWVMTSTPSFLFSFENLGRILAIGTVGFHLPSGFLNELVLTLYQVLSLVSDNATS